jgi:hypothetical protein
MRLDSQFGDHEDCWSWVVTPCSAAGVYWRGCILWGWRLQESAKRWCAFTRVYGVTPQKSISILYLEVCNFDVKGNEGIHEEEKRLEFTVFNAVAVLWFIVCKRALRHWWYVIVDSSLECDIYAYDVILYTTHLVSGLVPFGDWKKKGGITFLSNVPRFLKEHCFWQVPRLRPSVRLVKATYRWRWVWSSVNQILCSRTPCHVASKSNHGSSHPYLNIGCPDDRYAKLKVYI